MSVTAFRIYLCFSQRGWKT